MTLSLIAAIGKNNELGKNNTLLWNMPADMKHFRDTTRGHTVIMGRKTFESIGRPLPNRRNIVITRDNQYQKDGIEVVHSMEEALALVKDSDEEVFNIGGSEIYKVGMPFADKLYITHIDGSFDADAFFPEIKNTEWEQSSTEPYEKDAENPYNYSFTVYTKRT